MSRKRRISMLEDMNRRPTKKMSYEEIEKYLGLTAEEEALVTGKSFEEVDYRRWDYAFKLKRDVIPLLDALKEELPIGNTYQAAKHYGLTINEVMKRIRDGNLHTFRNKGKGRYLVWLK